uniref:Putative secreted protein n=1 Tax=Anopheles darlingi TaxID=43151 RepID=A0A2M4DB93_ANODA
MFDFQFTELFLHFTQFLLVALQAAGGLGESCIELACLFLFRGKFGTQTYQLLLKELGISRFRYKRYIRFFQFFL